MGFPNVIYGYYGDEKVQAAAKIGGLPLGTKMILPDGREFAHARAGASDLTAGLLLQGQAATADHDNERIVYGAHAIGATDITATLGHTTACTKDLYADGWMFVSKTTGIGHVHKVKACNSAAIDATCKFTLYSTDPLIVALAAASTEVGFRKNEYNGVVLRQFGTIVNEPLGTPPIAVTATQYFWLQKRGPAATLADGTNVAGCPVTASTAVDGALAPLLTPASAKTTAWEMHVLGFCIQPASTSGEYDLVDLKL